MADPNKIQDLTINDVTEGSHTLKGKGTFDVLMQSALTHLAKEYSDGRITGDNYAQAYVQIMGNVLNTATQFAVSKNQNNNNNIQLQASVELANQKVKTERANIEDTVDGVKVAGAIGSQNKVRQSQIDGMRKRALQDAVKAITDTWTVRESTSTHSTGTSKFNLLHDSNVGNAVKALFDENGIKVTVEPPGSTD